MLEEYLFACLSAELRTTNWTDPFSHMYNSTIEYSIALNEVLSLGFDGVLTLRARDPLRLLLLSIVQSTHSSTLVSCAIMKASFDFMWTDPRMQWRRATDIGNWTFPDSVRYPVSDVWVPSFRLANCISDQCDIRNNNVLGCILRHV